MSGIILAAGTDLVGKVDLLSPAVAATGTIALTAVVDGDTVTIDDGANTPTVFEFDEVGVAATGAIVIASGRLSPGNSITLHGDRYEIIKQVKATGSIVFSNRPADGNIVTLYDKTFEFLRPAKATGSIVLADRPADGNTITLHGKIFEFLQPVKSTGAIVLSGRAEKGDTITLHEETFEIVKSQKAAGSIVLSGRAVKGDTLELHGEIFEIVESQKATGSIVLSGRAEVGDTLEIHGETFEIVEVHTAFGTITLTGRAIKGDTVTVHGETFEFTESVKATGTIIVDSLRPSVGATATLHGNTFEFSNGGGVAAGHIEIDMSGGSDAEDDGIALLAAIKAAIPGLDNIATTGTSDTDYTIALTYGTVGVAGNSVITVSGSGLTKANMAGGDDGAAVGEGHIAVDLFANTTAAHDGADLLVAIKATIAGLNNVGSTGTDNLALAWGVAGSVGNSAITAVGTNIAPTDMTGGDDGEVTVPGNIAINIQSNSTAANDGDDILAALKSNIAGLIDSSVATDVNTTISLVWNVIGVAGNSVITAVGGNISKSNMTGGDDGTVTVPGNAAVDIIGNSTAAHDGADILTVIKATITELADSSVATAGDTTISLVWNAIGAVGNSAIVESGTNIAKSDMTGGDDGTVTTPGNIAVDIISNTTAAHDGADILAVLKATIVGLVDSTIVTAGNTTISLVWNVIGTVGDSAVTKVSANIAVTSMTGGVDAEVTTAGNVPVNIYANTTLAQDGASLLVAIKAQVAGLVDSTFDTDTISLVWNVIGPAGNSTLTKVGTNIAVTSMTGGIDADVATAGNVPVNISANTTMAQDGASLLVALKAQIAGLADSTFLTDTITLVWNVIGVVGNSAITKVGANITVTAMTGGNDGTLTTTISTFAVDITSAANITAEGALLLAALKANTIGLNNDNTTGALDSGHYDIVLTWGVPGPIGNSVITVVGANLSKTNMTGGITTGANVTGGSVGVVIGATIADSASNLVAAINATATLAVTSSVSNATTILLTNDVAGVTGNETITTDGDDIAVTGMAGGLAAITLRDLYTVWTQLAALLAPG